MIPLLGFLPDIDPTTQGVITDCDGLIPTNKGMRTAYSAANAGYSALDAECLGGTVARLVDNSARIFAGTETDLFEVQSGAWASVTRLVGGDYATSDSRWRFAQVGNVTLAVNYYDEPQFSITSDEFDDMAAMPKARYICTSGEFVVIGATDDTGTGLGAGPASADDNRVWWSAIGNYTSWNPDLATQAGTLQVLDTPGGITGLKQIGQSVAVYKESATYLLSYQGAGTLWTAAPISHEIGAVSNEAIVNTGTVHYLLGKDDFYAFDGNTIQGFGKGIKEWFFADYDPEKYYLVQSLYDRYRSLIYWFYPSKTGGGAVDKFICFHLDAKKWGVGSITIEAAMESISAGMSYDKFGAGLTWDTLPNVSYDSMYWAPGVSYPAVFNSAHTLCSLSGSSGTATWRHGVIGAESSHSLLRRVRPRWIDTPESATCVHRYGDSIDDMTAKDAVSMSRGRFDVRQSALFHAVELSTTGDAEIAGIEYDIVGAGLE